MLQILNATHILRSCSHDVISQSVTSILFSTQILLLHCVILYFTSSYSIYFPFLCILNLVFYPFLQYPLWFANAGESTLHCLFFYDFRVLSHEMAQWVMLPGAKPEALSLILETHRVEGEDRLESCPLLFTWVLWHTCAPLK